jgi:hypothetical protein
MVTSHTMQAGEITLCPGCSQKIEIPDDATQTDDAPCREAHPAAPPPSPTGRAADVKQEGRGASRIEVTLWHSVWQGNHAWTIPTVTINGRRHYCSWGEHLFEVEPGDYEVTVSYPWFFKAHGGMASVRVSVGPGETKRIRYRPSISIPVRGKITVE